MTTELSYSTINGILVDRFPALAPGYAAVRQRWEDEEPGPHIVFGDVLTPALIASLEGDPTGLPLAQVFALLEDMATNPDHRLQEVVGVTVLERLNDKKTWRDRAREFMGPRTRRLSDDVERAWG